MSVAGCLHDKCVEVRSRIVKKCHPACACCKHMRTLLLVTATHAVTQRQATAHHKDKRDTYSAPNTDHAPKQIPTLTSSTSPLSQARCKGLGHCVTRCLKGMAGKLSVVKGRFTSAPFSTSSCRDTHTHLAESLGYRPYALHSHVLCLMQPNTLCLHAREVLSLGWYGKQAVDSSYA